MANLYFYADSSCSSSAQLSHSAVSITGTTLTAAALISYPGTAPEGQELDYWMISGKLAGLSDTKAEVGKDVVGYIVSDALMLYPVWRTIITFTPAAISAVPMGNVVAPQGATIRRGSSYTYNSAQKKWVLTDMAQDNYDIVITPADIEDPVPATQVSFTSTDSNFNATNIQTLGSQLIAAVKTLQTSDTDRVAKSGDTMTGNLIMNQANINVDSGALTILNNDDGFITMSDSTIEMSDPQNQVSYFTMYDVDSTSNKYSVIYRDSLNKPIYIVGVEDPISDTGVANRRYVLNAIGAATTDIKAYIDAAIAEKIADAIGGAY